MPDSPFLSMFAPAGTGAGPTALGGMFDPAAMRQQKLWDMLGGLGAGLLQASAPRVGPPLGFGDILGAGLVGANQAANAGEDKYLKRALIGAQVATAAAKVKQQQDWAKLMGGAAEPANPAATTAPTMPSPTSGVAPDKAATGQAMVSYLTQKGLSPVAAASIAGNLYQESSFNPNATHDGGRGYGMAGWDPQRTAGLNQFAQAAGKPPSDPQVQVDYLLSEMKGGDMGAQRAWQMLQTAKTPEEGTTALMHFFRPAGYTPSNPQGGNAFAQRVQYANSFLPQGGPPPAAMPSPPATMMAGGPPPAQMPGPPPGVIPPGPPPAQMPQMPSAGGVSGPPVPLNPMGQIAQPPGMPAGAPPVAQGDASGNPVQQAQFTPQAPPAAPPAPGTATLRDIVQSLSPGVRQIVGTMGPEKGMEYLLKQAEPVASPALDTMTGQVVFVDKNRLGKDPRYQPVDAAKLRMEGDRLQLEKRRSAVDEANKDIVLGPDGLPRVNQAVVESKKAVSAVQGTDTAGKMLLGDYEDVRKANTEMQSGALMARTGMAQTNRLAGLLDQVNTGKFTSSTQEIKQMAKGLGVNLEALGVKDDTAPAQAIQALRGQMALALRNPSQGAGMPGAMSDADRQYLDRMVAGLDNTPEGNKLMIDASRKLYQRQIDMAKIANDFMRSGEAKKDPNALYQKLQDYADKNPLFSEKDLPQPVQPKPDSLPGKVRRFNPATGALE